MSNLPFVFSRIAFDIFSRRYPAKFSYGDVILADSGKGSIPESPAKSQKI